MKRFIPALLLLQSVAISLPASAPTPEVVPIWANGTPGTEGKRDRPEKTVPSPKNDYLRVSQIHHPSLTVHLPPAEQATGTGVLILPGGGYQFLSIDLEGSEIASWFTERGIAAFVVKYRLPREPDSTYTMDDALADTQRAIRLVRSRASDWGLRPDRIGILGFSAGGRLAADAGLRFQDGQPSATDPLHRVSSRPDFQILVYGFTAPDAIPANTPPTFLICTSDDGDKPRQAIALYSALLTNKVPTELHLYGRGGHAYGMRNLGQPVHSWNQRLADWLDNLGLMKPVPVAR
ncbi:MAG: Alpha/beta hydrolase [Verrucomicrobiota bacterium]|nr:Alpha/beta hydrolase [Verrucomicrobiota bacterium]